jgi:hypothetical protein
MARKHPHPDRMAEVYRRWKDGSGYEFLGYTADPIKGADWDASMQAWVIPSDGNFKE